MSRCTRRTRRPHSRNRLYRSSRDRALLGVCAGVADYWNLDPWVVRVGAVIALFVFTVPAVLGYLLAGWLLEPAPADLYASRDEEAFWQRVRTEPKQTVRGLRHRNLDIERRLRAIEAYVTSREFGLRRDIDGLED